MEIIRTANAGVLLKLDGVSILLDGVCREVKPYPATPPEERALLSKCYPDVVAFTHSHKDHYDPAYVAGFEKQTGGVILGPEGLPGVSASMKPLERGGVTVIPVSSRHIGVAGKTVSHASFIIKGTSCIWFLGDASPSLWRNREDLPRPDVLMVPYAYAATPAGWAATKALGAKRIVLLHMPNRGEDTLGLWEAVETTVKGDEILHIPAMGETLYLNT